MKQVLKCNTPDCSSTSTIQAEQPIADYVEDLQFSGFKDGSIASTGAVEYGMGNKKWFFQCCRNSFNHKFGFSVI